VTGIVFIDTGYHIISTSKDGLMKLWDISLQSCIETAVEHRTEIWSIVISSDRQHIYTGAADNYLRVWSLNNMMLESYLKKEDLNNLQILQYEGSILKQSKDRTLGLSLSSSEYSLLFCIVS
jgi:U3 small nucleolar RNA-associated protein 12